jgi:hypothetical protein
MPRGYLQIPDWFSFENQGGNIAAADLSGTGKNDLIVFMIDSAVGQNRGLFRIGRNLDAIGQPIDGWTAWLEVPDWFSWENQGAGIAAADIDHDGKQDLVVFMIDSPPGQNAGFYRVGKALDVNGNVAGGWGSVDSDSRLGFVREPTRRDCASRSRRRWTPGADCINGR